MNTRCGFRAVVSPPPASTSCIWSRASNSFIAIDRGGARHWYRSSHPATRTQRTYSLQCSAARQGATGCSGASEKAAATCRAAGAALRLQAPASWYDTHAAPARPSSLSVVNALPPPAPRALSLCQSHRIDSPCTDSPSRSVESVTNAFCVRLHAGRVDREQLELHRGCSLGLSGSLRQVDPRSPLASHL